MCTGFPYTVRASTPRQVRRLRGDSSAGAGPFGAWDRRRWTCATWRRADSTGFWEERLHPWDIAAGVVIVEEAGGRVSAYDGGPLHLFSGEVVSSNGKVHQQMLDVLAEAGRHVG